MEKLTNTIMKLALLVRGMWRRRFGGPLMHLYTSETMARQAGFKRCKAIGGRIVMYTVASSKELDWSWKYSDWRKVGEAWKRNV